ncbi:MAG: Holliday junction resolvase RuvX [bacterium]|jgi:putative Holliday junction resolvase|nr:Holliday junction resolvase RuvX [Betaproteobacteria bacterium]
MHEQAGTVLAFDYGTRRIGVAVGDLGQRSAHPLTTIDASDRAASEAKITALVDEWRPARLVVGVPFSLDGREHQMTRSARAFGRALSRRHSLPVSEVDERLTSVDAEATLREAGLDRSRRAGLVDAQAAFIILRSFMLSLEAPR